ncbi:helix-turn-helix domain containing protein [Parvibaculaceae bacterium PLY_AMNH_Bact1]|nr:helix-turn-helix domain containing protein [Parvibaculaceae bacterium PLY_AMNH_Bact1]
MAAEHSDGRSNRGVRTHERIVIALFELIKEGNLQPRGEEIAERAGVAVRTLFRHFDDMEGLFDSAQAFMSEQLDVDHVVPKIEGTLEERALAYAKARGTTYEENRNYLLFYVSRAKTEEEANALRSAHAQSQRLRLWSAVPEVAAADPDVRHSVEAFFSFQMWDQLRFKQGLPVETCHRVIASSTVTLLSKETVASVDAV